MKEIILRSIVVHPAKWQDFAEAIVQSNAIIRNAHLTVYNVYQERITISFANSFTLEFDSLSKLKAFVDFGFLVESHK